MKKFYYIALEGGATREGVVRSESIDSARHELMQQGLEKIHIAILRSDDLDFLDLDEAGIRKKRG
jgi:type II secretory pathway component PulF